jgi:hypothetical protein
MITPQNAMVISASAACMSLVLPSLTFVFAVFIFREAKRIREIEWITSTNSAWNDFNKLVLTDPNHKEWVEFLTTDSSDYDKYEPFKRVNWILFNYLNVLVSTMHSAKAKHKNKSYFDEILQAEFRLMNKRQNYVSQFLEQTGYDPEFIAMYRRYL